MPIAIINILSKYNNDCYPRVKGTNGSYTYLTTNNGYGVLGLQSDKNAMYMDTFPDDQYGFRVIHYSKSDPSVYGSIYALRTNEHINLNDINTLDNDYNKRKLWRQVKTTTSTIANAFRYSDTITISEKGIYVISSSITTTVAVDTGIYFDHSIKFYNTVVASDCRRPTVPYDLYRSSLCYVCFLNSNMSIDINSGLFSTIADIPFIYDLCVACISAF